MRGKATSSNPKFFRRTSESPWDSSKTGFIPQNNHLLFESKPTSNSSINGLKASQANKQKVLQSSLVKLSNAQSISMVVSPQNNYHSKPTNNQSRGSSQRIFRRDSDEMKMTYIPMESVSTIESVIASKKKVGGQESVQINKEQEICRIKYELTKAREQTKRLTSDQMFKDTEIIKLSNQMAQYQHQNERLQKQLTSLHHQLLSIQQQYAKQKSLFHKLTSQLEESRAEKLKFEETIELMKKSLNKHQNNVKSLREENGQLIKIIESKRVFESGNVQKVNKIGKSGIQNKVINANVLQERVSRKDYENLAHSRAQLTEKQLQSLSKQNSKKASQSTQAENSKLEILVKQNETLSKSISNNFCTQKKLRYQITQMQEKLKNTDYLFGVVEECQKLIQNYNESIIKQGICHLAIKYKGFKTHS